MRLLLLLLLVWVIPAAAAPAPQVALAPTGDLIVSGDDEGHLQAVDAAGKLVAKIPGLTDRVHGLAFRDADNLVAWSRDDHILLWNRRTREVKVPQSPPDHQLSYGALSTNGRYLATSGQGRIVIWDLQNGRVVGRPDIAPLEDPHMAFSRDGTLLAASMGANVVLFAVPSGKRLLKLKKDAVFNVADLKFSEQGTLLTLDEHSLREWSTTTGLPVSEIIGLGFDSAGRIVLADDGPGVVVSGERDIFSYARIYPDRGDRTKFAEVKQVQVEGYLSPTALLVAGEEGVRALGLDGTELEKLPLPGPLLLADPSRRRAICQVGSKLRVARLPELRP